MYFRVFLDVLDVDDEVDDLDHVIADIHDLVVDVLGHGLRGHLPHQDVVHLEIHEPVLKVRLREHGFLTGQGHVGLCELHILLRANVIHITVPINLSGVLLVIVHPCMILQLTHGQECQVVILLEGFFTVQHDADEIIHTHWLVLVVIVLASDIVHDILVDWECLCKLVVVLVKDDNMGVLVSYWVSLHSIHEVILHVEDRKVTILDLVVLALDKPKMLDQAWNFQ